MSEWISVEERLPEQYDSVIVWTVYGEMGEAEYDGKHFSWAYDNDYALVTHWMPLPEPPGVTDTNVGGKEEGVTMKYKVFYCGRYIIEAETIDEAIESDRDDAEVEYEEWSNDDAVLLEG